MCIRDRSTWGQRKRKKPLKKEFTMPFRHLAQVGRVVQVNYGKDYGKIGVIVDLIDVNRALVENPETGLERQVIPFSRLTTTRFLIPMCRGLRSGQIKKTIAKFDLTKKWSATNAAKRAASLQRRRTLNDFERFRVQVLRQGLARTSRKQARAIRKTLPKVGAKAPAGKQAETKAADAGKGKGKEAAPAKKKQIGLVVPNHKQSSPLSFTYLTSMFQWCFCNNFVFDLIFKRSIPNFLTSSQRKRMLGQLLRIFTNVKTVSYTHLTLPTIYSVQISVVAVSLKKKKQMVSSVMSSELK
eukprot:TRINITY_DN5_c0_g1_i1.p1 TRINITY_DN5_c0_g1~~TRINITY_DN5_c0_g1_i1.p1  ORF type:complete len:325 (+),score=90.07 TRINITY_DN5_c0_g1_i1:82-975(+)